MELDFETLKRLNTLTFECEIEIVAVYDLDEQRIPKEKWMQHGVV